MLEEKLKGLPSKSGVYLLKDESGGIVYIGKARLLNKRVRQYFQDKEKLPSKTSKMVAKVHDIEYILTDNELEALFLENNLIKKHKPRYNVLLKDDKNFPYLKLTMKEDFPRLLSTRKLKDDGALYFGPYTPANQLWKMVAVLRKYFKLRQCKTSSLKERARPCINFQIGLCTSPCSGRISREQYRQIVNDVKRILNGRVDSLVSDLEERMYKAADNMEFERAAHLRDQINAINKVMERQKIITGSFIDRDYIAFFEERGLVCIQIFFVRGGVITGRRHFVLGARAYFDVSEILAQFIRQYYSGGEFIPSEILCEIKFEDYEVIEDYLTSIAGQRVKFAFPQKGEKKKLIALVKKNAEMLLNEHIRNKVKDKSELVDELQKRLGLRNRPRRIEGFDISTLHGVLAVGSMVCFIEGEPQKSEYRRFKIRTLEEMNDVGMMIEVLSRHFKKKLETKAPMPDLLLVDGGKMHLNAALSVLEGLDVKGIDVLAIAKPDREKKLEIHDRVYRPNVKDPIVLKKHHPSYHILQNVRDEAHRFAISYHKKLRSKSLRSSILDEIPGVGEKRKKLLLRHFGSLKRLKEASLEEIISLGKIDEKTGRIIYRYLKEC